MLFTTTSNLEGWLIESYLGTVSAHAVLGTGLFTDIASGFTDLFGARSGAYAEKLDELEKFVSDQLTWKAKTLRATAIIGLRVDYDEVGAGGKSMLMVTARGTAVRAFPCTGSSDMGPKIVNDMDIDIWLQRKSLLDLAKEGQLRLDATSWNFIIDHRVEELAPYILSSFDRAAPDARRLLFSFFDVIPKELVGDVLYEAMLLGDNISVQLALSLLSEVKAFWPDGAIKLLRSDSFFARWAGVQSIRAKQSAYSQNDLAKYKELFEVLSACEFPMFPIQTVKTLFGTKKVWCCPWCGEQTSPEENCFCSSDTAGFHNNVDFTVKEALQEVSLRIKALESIFRSKDD